MSQWQRIFSQVDSQEKKTGFIQNKTRLQSKRFCLTGLLHPVKFPVNQIQKRIYKKLQVRWAATINIWNLQSKLCVALAKEATVVMGDWTWAILTEGNFWIFNHQKNTRNRHETIGAGAPSGSGIWFCLLSVQTLDQTCECFGNQTS